jgi:hypothetical protein
MVVGLLAVLKADGAYLPLDPHYPQASPILFIPVYEQKGESLAGVEP